MSRRLAALAACWVFTMGCDGTGAPFPQPRTPFDRMATDAGFPIEPRASCSDVVAAALADPDLGAISRAASENADFTCGGVDRPLPLDRAILSRSVERVRALLEAGADPDARWSSHGDRFPLQEVIETHRYAEQQPDRAAMVHLLLQHGADPDARWCPDGSRQTSASSPPCSSDTAATPLFVAAALDQVDVTYLLLDAGADAMLSTWTDQSALHQAWREPVFELLAWAMFPDRETHAARTLRYLQSTRPTGDRPSGESDWTPLARAIRSGSTGYLSFVPGPPFHDLAEYRIARTGVVKAILRLGADPNERVSAGIDWTPLKLAVDAWDPDIVEMLLARGADPDARWCTTAVSDSRRVAGLIYRQIEGCRRANGLTALMLGASFGRTEVISTLLEHGADPALEDWQRRKAADHARSSGYHDVAATLERR